MTDKLAIPADYATLLADSGRRLEARPEPLDTNLPSIEALEAELSREPDE